MYEFKIEKGIPIPTKNKYPLKEMRAGDSFLVPEETASTQASIHRSAKELGMKITTRRTKEGFRVWCVTPARGK